MVQKAKGGKKQRKWGRNAIYCAYYRSTHRREKNKLVRLVKHLLRFPNDNCAVRAVDACHAAIRGY